MSSGPVSAKVSAKPALIPQANGKGALYAGGVPGNRGGRKPKSEIREQLLDVIEDHGVKFARDVLSGETPASVAEKAMVFDKAAKYGLGTEKELNAEAVRGRNAATRETLRSDLPSLIRSMAPRAVTTVANEVLPLETPEDVAAAIDKLIGLHWVK